MNRMMFFNWTGRFTPLVLPLHALLKNGLPREEDAENALEVLAINPSSGENNRQSLSITWGK